MTSSGSISSFRRHASRALAPAENWVRAKERLFATVLWLAGGLAFASIAATVILLAVGSWPALSRVGVATFFFSTDWHPTAGDFNLVPMTLGTLAVSVGALVIAGPFALICAVFTRFYVPESTASAFRTVLHLLAGIPSVVYGLWGIALIVPWIVEWDAAGPSMLAGIVVLAIMILPTIAVISDTALRQLPPALYQGGIALGLPRYRVVWRVVLPAARNKLLAAAILGLARALGETMALLMVTGNNIALPTHLLASIRTLSANVALEMAYALDVHRSALFVTGLVLMVLVLVVLAIATRLEDKGAVDTH